MAVTPRIFDLAGVLAEAGLGDLAEEVVEEAGQDFVAPNADSAGEENRRPRTPDEQIDTAVTLLKRRLVASAETFREAERIAGELSDRPLVRFDFGRVSLFAAGLQQDATAQLTAVLDELAQDLRDNPDGV